MSRIPAVAAALLGVLAVRADDPPPAPVFQRALVLQRRAAPEEAVTVTPDQAEQDRKALDSVGLKADDPAGLLKYIKDRTLNDVDLTRILNVIKRFASEDFEERVKASEEIERIGDRALDTLSKAAKDDSSPPEVVFRARLAIKRIQKVPHAEVVSAAVRGLVGTKDKEAAAVLLGFLPITDSPQVVEQIQATLTANAGVAGRPDPALLAALKDADPLRRRVAAVALVEAPGLAAEVRAKEVAPAVKAALTGEKDVAFRFAVARSLVLSGTDRDGVKLLIELLPDLDRGQIWQAEDLLVQVGGADGPKARCQKSPESKAAARVAWSEWWDKAGATATFGPGAVVPRTQGRFHLVTLDFRFGQGMVTEYTPDEKERWRLGNLGMPIDMTFLPNGRLLVADQNQNALVEWNPNGTKAATHRFEVDNPAGGGGKTSVQPKGLQLLPDGGVLVFGGNALVVYDKDWKPAVSYVRPQANNMDLCAACKLRNGEFAVSVLNAGPNGQDPKIVFLDAKGKEIKGRSVKTGPGTHHQGSMVEVADGRVLFAEVNRIVEIDLKTGKEEMKKPLNQPRSVQRLPNGNTLFVDHNQYPCRVVEQTADGKEAWSFPVRNDNASVLKAFVR